MDSKTKYHHTPDTPRSPQQPGDRDYFETAYDETHPTRYSPFRPDSINAGFVGIGLVQLSQSIKTKNVTDRQTDIQTDVQTDRLIN